MYEKLLIANQSLMLIIAIALIVILFHSDNTKCISELEHRQTNHLTYLEGRLNAEASKLNKIANSYDSRLDIIELRQETKVR